MLIFYGNDLILRGAGKTFISVKGKDGVKLYASV